MTTIKMNDGRTQSFIELTDTQLGRVLLNVNNILSVRATNNV